MKTKKFCRARISSFFKEFTVLLRSIPSPIVAFFVVAVITMNLLANKTIVNLEFLAVDGGILVSWIVFLCMDTVTKHFGPRASTLLSVFAMFVNLLTCLIFYIVSVIPTSDDYSAFNTIIGGTWFILLSSTAAFIASAVVNNFLNHAVGKIFKKNPDGMPAFITRGYVSTFIAQFVDNFIFASLTFMVFAPIFWDGFSWSFAQCLTCSILGAALELAFEAVFSPFGYMICRRWKKSGVGKDYFDFTEKKKNENID